VAILVERENIGIFGKMNAGKSSILNLLTQSESSITDSTPGTTADTKVAMQEIHGIGPVKLSDTAGINEDTPLGSKKRRKVESVLKETDLALLVIDPESRDFTPEQFIFEKARENGVQIITIFNLFSKNAAEDIPEVNHAIPALNRYPSISLSAIDTTERNRLLSTILNYYEPKNDKRELLPFVEKDRFYVLIIPMDVETPPGRFLRPQSMVQEYITRKWAYPVPYRIDLNRARSENADEVLTEYRRFESFLHNLPNTAAVITDSQAMDIISQWVPVEILLTTFSIVMINYFSRGRLPDFASGIRTLDTLKQGDKILIVEACNHSRSGDDIGTVQIPRFLEKHYPSVHVDFNFGREFYDNERISEYSLIIHCGGCMISSQKLLSRIRELEAAGVPYTNYGLFLSYMSGREALSRVIEPFQTETASSLY